MKNKNRVPAAAAPLVTSTPSFELPASVLARWNPDVRAAAEPAADAAVITIMGPIGAGFWGEDGGTVNTPQRIAAALRSIGKRPVTVHLHSPGGSFFDGIGIYNVLRDHDEQVDVKVLGLAASAASIIAMAADTLMVPRAGFVMIHNTQGIAIGDRHDMKDMVAFLGPFDEVIASVYAARSGIDAKELGLMMDRETWLGGEAAVAQGLADQLLAADEVQAATVASPHAVAALAAHKLDVVLAKAGMVRAERRALIKALKNSDPTGTPGAALVEPAATTPGAGGDLAEVLSILRSIR